MWRNVFAVLACVPLCAAAQGGNVPGRDLLTFPVTLVVEGPATGDASGVGLWNPALTLLPTGSRWRIAAGAMTAPTDAAINAQYGGFSHSWRGTTVSVSVLRSSVGRLLRTDSDPLSLGEEVPYETVLLTAGVARRIAKHVVLGLAAHARSGLLDGISRSANSLDAGLLVDHLTPLDVSVGASSFLHTTWTGAGSELAALLLGVDGRVFGTDSVHTLRAGYSYQRAVGLYSEQFAYGAGRWSMFELRGGTVRTDIYGQTNWRLRLGMVARYGGYTVGVAREETPNGFAPSYQFTLSTLLP